MVCINAPLVSFFVDFVFDFAILNFCVLPLGVRVPTETTLRHRKPAQKARVADLAVQGVHATDDKSGKFAGIWGCFGKLACTRTFALAAAV
jgi:hypothetical protein